MKDKIGNKFIREICIAGPVIDVTMKYSARAPRKPRGANRNPSKEEVVKNNDRIATKNLTRLMNANFYPGDFHATFTYKGDEPSVEDAKRELRNFKHRMKREYKKLGKEFRWIEVTEYRNHRVHHHVVMNYIDPAIIARQWKAGHVRLTALDRSRNYRKLAEYFVKETTKTMREPGGETKQRWSASKNLIRPIIKREIIEPKAMYEKPKAFKGYELLPETINPFTHPFTGIDHLEYMMVATDPVPRIKTWRKGEIVRRDETYKRAKEIQISWDALDSVDLI